MPPVMARGCGFIVVIVRIDEHFERRRGAVTACDFVVIIVYATFKVPAVSAFQRAVTFSCLFSV